MQSVWLLLTDIHGRTWSIVELEKEIGKLGLDVELIVIAGDFTYFKPVKRAIEIIEFIKQSFNAPIFFVPGNCDHPRLLEWSKEEAEIYNIHGKPARYKDWIFYGIGGSNKTPFMTYIEWGEDEIRELVSPAEKYPREKLVMVTHVPVYGYLDDVGGEHVGSKTLRRFLERHGAKLWVTGHIHEARGYIVVNNTHLVNPGPLMWGYYAIAIFSGDRLEVQLKQIGS